MFFHKQELQHQATPERPDAVYARKLQEVLGGQYGEITVALQYQFQAWNMHIPGKYRDLVFGIGAEEMGHVEMLSVMIAQLLEDSPIGITEEAVQSDPTVAAVVGGTDVQHGIVAGAGARAVDSMGNPWQGSYITASGNLLADFQANANAEMQGRLQVARRATRHLGARQSDIDAKFSLRAIRDPGHSQRTGLRTWLPTKPRIAAFCSAQLTPCREQCRDSPLFWNRLLPLGARKTPLICENSRIRGVIRYLPGA